MSVSLIRVLRVETLINRFISSKFRINSLQNVRKFQNTPVFLNPRGTHQNPNNTTETLKEKVPLAFSTKYKIFDDSDSKIIVDTLDEVHSKDEDIVFDEFEGISLQRGITGVFEIEELVSILQRENAKDIFVVAVPASCKFVEHMCIVSGRSTRHMAAIAEFIRRVYKKKRHETDIIPRIEGKTSKDWIALDLGNIALNIFSEKARIYYDLEQLWSVGPEFDSLYNGPENNLMKLLEIHSKTYLSDLIPDEK